MASLFVDCRKENHQASYVLRLSSFPLSTLQLEQRVSNTYQFCCSLVVHQWLPIPFFLLWKLLCSLRYVSTSSCVEHQVLYLYPCPETTIEELGIKNWPIWTCEESSFDWTYDDKEIRCLLESAVMLTPNGGEPVKFSVGDLVAFLPCIHLRWDVHKAVRKYYWFCG